MMKLARKYKDLSIEGAKAREYDDFSRTYRMGDFREFAALAQSRIAEGARVLEVATGPGYFCIELAALGDYEIAGLDISHDLIEMARDHARKAAAEVAFVQGNASAMPFEDGSVDLVFCSWAMKNFMDPERVFMEMYRVLKPGGTALIVDLDRDATGRDWRAYAVDRGLTGMTSLAMSLAFRIQRTGAYSKTRLMDLVASTPFEVRDVARSGINLCVSLTR